MTDGTNRGREQAGTKAASDPELIPVIDCAPAEVSEIDLYQKREKIYTRKIEGFFQRIRLFTGWPLLAGYFLLPWVNWGDRQAVLFDLAERQFHIFGITFWPQDLVMLTWILVIAAFALFAVTNLAGRVWCGYTCPQTVWTSIFMWLEQRVEGTRNQRIKLDAAPWSLGKVVRKSLKHALWLGFAFYTGFTFVGYFTPIHELGWGFYSLAVSPTALFWVGFFTLATYGNAGWLREQVCLYMCPYARFQSAMFDQDTLVISYDPARGEPRGSRKRDQRHSEREVGDCIDCQLCVQVCPVGIDIRDGLQYECIGCALCIDACNSIMDKMQYPKGLIRYTTAHALEHKPSRIMRPRLVGYIIAIAIMVTALVLKLATRETVELSVIRDRQDLFTMNTNGYIENAYTLKIANKTQQPHDYAVNLHSALPLEFKGPATINVSGGEVVDFRVKLALAPGHATQANNTIIFSVTREDDGNDTARAESRFFTPGKSP